VNASLDWYFAWFRRENAVNATVIAVQLLDFLIAQAGRGSEELANYKDQCARQTMDKILDRYESIGIFPNYQRAEPPSQRG
jgi:hypothetical protein